MGSLNFFELSHHPTLPRGRHYVRTKTNTVKTNFLAGGLLGGHSASMPRSLKHILVMQPWQHQLSHEIYHGILDYVGHQAPGLYSCARFPWDIDRLRQQGPTLEVDAFVAPMVNEQMYALIRTLKWNGLSTHIGVDTPGIPQVDIDHEATGRMAAEYLQRLGTDHFAYVGLTVLRALTLRRDGFVHALRSQGRTVHSYEVPLTLEAPLKGTPAFSTWMKRLPKPVAIYCSDDDLAVDLITRCKHLGFSVPDDMAVLGTQDDPALCREVLPGLSSVHLPYHKVGYEAMGLIHGWLRRGKPPVHSIAIPPSHITARPSTDILALPDPQIVKAVRYLRDHCCEKTDLNAVARHAGLSLRVMQLRFQALLGHTPGEEQRRARLERVKQLLRETSLSLEEIAERCGFANANTLCEHFKNVTGKTPGAYRKHA
jgi:LacI family transcriptional regulator